MIKKIIYIVFLIFLSTSCKEIAEKTSETIIENQKKEISGKYHTIKDEKIKVFLPEEFKYTNTQNYLNQIAQSGDSSAYYAEKKRFKDIHDSGKKIYLFEYLKGASIVKVLPERYVAFTNSDAKYMLGIVDNIIKANNTGMNFEIMESQFKGNKNISIFKVIYQVKSPKLIVDMYKYVYFISYNKKSVFVNLETPSLLDFDPYIQKIRL